MHGDNGTKVEKDGRTFQVSYANGKIVHATAQASGSKCVLRVCVRVCVCVCVCVSHFKCAKLGANSVTLPHRPLAASVCTCACVSVRAYVCVSHFK